MEEYHNFVPWCARSVIVQRHNDSRFDAELEVGFRVFVERCATKLLMSMGQPHCTVRLRMM